jgi:RimJ/RimL family protein N-acetyltransferase
MLLSLQLDNDTQLRVLEEEDAEILYTTIEADRPHLRRWRPSLAEVTSVDLALTMIQQSLKGFAADTNYIFGIWQGRELIGNVAYNKYEAAIRKNEISAWIITSHEGKGYITKALWLLLDYGFRQRKLNRIVGRCDTKNVRTRSVNEKLGFVLEGVLRQGGVAEGELIDIALYSVLAEEWFAQQTQLNT